jgi:hypothetical protein
MVYFEFPDIDSPPYIDSMTKSQTSDPNQIAARVVGETAARHNDVLPADVEAAWERWIAGVGKVDTRARSLLRAAFEVGVEQGTKQKVTRP